MIKGSKVELEEIKEVTETPSNCEFKIEDNEPLKRQVGFKM
jgi:hypothetical protein